MVTSKLKILWWHMAWNLCADFLILDEYCSHANYEGRKWLNCILVPLIELPSVRKVRD
jgi:hypothetical protein